MSKKIIAIFSGQGSQFTGMGKELYTNSEAARNVFNEAVEVMGEDILKLCFETELETLTQTVNAQPAIYTVSYAAYAAFKEYLKNNNIENDIEFSAFAGHSLGEYTAIAASGASTFKKTLEFVNYRAQYMQKCGEENEGTMAAVMGLSFEDLDKLCKEIATELNTIISVGLFNTPVQLVASGTIVGVNELCKRAVDAGARRAMPLTVGGPFHTAIMTPAAEKLKEHKSILDLQKPAKPVALNGFGIVTDDVAKIDEGLIKQMNNPILWVKCVEELQKLHPDAAFIEFCPKNVLKGLVKKIDRKIEIYTVDTMDSIKETMDKINENNESAGV